MTLPSRCSSAIEVLETRIALSVTPLSVGRALDLDDSITVTLSGNGQSFAAQSLGVTGQLLGFPSGGDGDFLILSTGIASHLTTVKNLSDAQGTDLGPIGSDGDSPSVAFTLPVPEGAGPQRLKIDFLFLTEEFPDFVGQGFNDHFEILINGVNYAEDEFGNPIEVDNVFFTGEPAPGTYFNGRSNKLTLTYAVPDGTTELNVELRLTEVGDGEYDSAVLVDNVRFESPQVVYLDFDGATMAGHFGPGITAFIPAFDASDIGSGDPTSAIIAQIVQGLQDKFSAYDIFFTTNRPTAGDFTTLVVGGDNSILLDISGASPLVQNQYPGGSVSMSTFFNLGADSLLGYAGAPDVGNYNRNDQAVVFSGEFDDFFGALSPAERLDHMVVTLAHELGHNLGLRHLTDGATTDVMKQSAPRLPNAIFGNTLLGLAEEWSDGVTSQNDDAYLASVLGRANASGLAFANVQGMLSFSTQGQPPLFDVTLTITSGDSDAAPIVLHFDRLDGAQNIPLPNVPLGAKISITAATQLGGALNVFSGVPVSGGLTDSASQVPLFNAQGGLLDIPIAKGTPGSLVAGGTLKLATNELGDVTLLPGKVGTFTDADGDVYTIKLTGPGMIGYVLDDPDQDGRGGLVKLRLDDTTLGESVLSITVKKGKNGDGFINIGEISGSLDAALKQLNAAPVNLDGGGVIFSGALGTVTLRDLVNGADLIAGPDDGTLTNVTVHRVADGSDISIGTAVKNFKAARIEDANITLAALTKLTVTGDKAAGLPGDLGAQMTIAGLLGSVSARDLLSTALIEAGGTALDRTTLAFHEVMNGASIALASVVTSLKAARIGDAIISAQQFDTILVTGDKANFIPGDFGAELSAIYKIGKFTARDILGTASITATGLVTDVTTFTAHAIMDGASIFLESSVGTFKAAFVGEATITVAAINSLQITGDAKAWIPGDFLGTLRVEGGDPFFLNTLKNMKVSGLITDASIVAESIGKLNAKGMSGSEVFAGFTPANSGDPLAGGVFFEGSAIQSFTIGKGGFANSVIAADAMGTISINTLVAANGGEDFGFILGSVPGKVTVTGFTYVKGGPAEQRLEDFVIKVV